MPPSQTRRAFLAGAADALPLQLAVAPFGLIFGALAAAAGLGAAEAMGMSLVVVAGAAQLATLQQMSEAAPAVMAILTGAVVNLRMAMYSAALAPAWRGASARARLGAAFVLFDMTYALAERRRLERPEQPLAETMGYHYGVGLTCLAVWAAASLAGVALGARIPPEWGLSVAPPLVFISVAAPFLRTPPHIAAAAVAAGAALLAAGLPYGLGLSVGAGAGIATGVLAETLRGRR